MPGNGWSSFAPGVRRWIRAPLTLLQISIGRKVFDAGVSMADHGATWMEVGSDRLMRLPERGPVNWPRVSGFVFCVLAWALGVAGILHGCDAHRPILEPAGTAVSSISPQSQAQARLLRYPKRTCAFAVPTARPSF